jgi:hypothetical protein
MTTIILELRFVLLIRNRVVAERHNGVVICVTAHFSLWMYVHDRIFVCILYAKVGTSVI